MSTSTPLVSVHMLAFNTAPYIKIAIESVLSQTLQDFEFLILDDGSTDGTSEVIRSYMSDPRIRLISHSSNQGLARCRSELTLRSLGKYIAIADSDDIQHFRRLELSVRELESHPDCVLVGCQAAHLNAEGATLSQIKMFPDTFRECLTNGRLNTAPASHVFRRSDVERVGGYDLLMDNMWEDLDLATRLLKTGFGTNLPQCLMGYRLRSAGSICRNFHLLGTSPNERAGLKARFSSDYIYLRRAAEAAFMGRRFALAAFYYRQCLVHNYLDIGTAMRFVFSKLGLKWRTHPPVFYPD